MNCKMAQELLMTGYIDDELDAEKRGMVKEHLAGCPSCAAFEAGLRMYAVEPFKGASGVLPPESVWHRIAGSIKEERETGSVFTELRRSAAAVFSFPKPVFLAATMAMMLIAAAVFLHYRYADDRSLRLYIEEEMTYISSPAENADAADEGMLADIDILTREGFSKWNFSRPPCV